MARTTRTYVLVEVPNDLYTTIWQKLVDAGYEDQIDEEEFVIDMHGLAITPEPAKIKQSMEVVGQTERGYTIFREPNEVGGHRYWSDEVGGGVIVWDTSLVSADTLKLTLNLEEKRDAEERGRVEKERRIDQRIDGEKWDSAIDASAQALGDDQET